MILILAPHTDDHAVAVLAELHRRGEKAVVFDVAELPQQARISVSFEPGRPFGATVRRATGSFDLADVRAVWLRRTGTPSPPALGDRWFAIAESQHLLLGLAQALADRRWVNPLHALALDGGWGKIRQLQVARAVGLEVPRTLMTNDPEEARAFVASCAGGAIYKPFASRDGYDRNGRHAAIFTTDVAPDADLSPVAHAPVILQEKIQKRVELRATVMGSKVFAIEIHSQEDPASLTDYRRRYLDVPHALHQLPDELAAKLVGFHRALGLVFGTADLILEPDGRYRFLETNQQGQWLWTAKKIKLPLVEAFCDLLTLDPQSANPLLAPHSSG